MNIWVSCGGIYRCNRCVLFIVFILNFEMVPVYDVNRTMKEIIGSRIAWPIGFVDLATYFPIIRVEN